MTRPTCLGRQNPNCPAPWHGTQPAYDRVGCRCPHAREASRLYRKRRREGRQPAGRVNATGTRRRLQALNAIGWPYSELAPRLGLWPGNVGHLASDNRPHVHRTTHNRVAALYRELSATPGPSPAARRFAAAKGWLSPAWWENIDDPNECPTPHMVTAGETPDQRRRRHADRYNRFLELRAAGHGSTVIRRELGNINSIIYRQLVERHQAEQHATAEAAA